MPAKHNQTQNRQGTQTASMPCKERYLNYRDLKEQLFREATTQEEFDAAAREAARRAGI